MGVTRNEPTTVRRLTAPAAKGFTLAALTLGVENIPGVAKKLADTAGLFSLRDILELAELPITTCPLPEVGWVRSFNDVGESLQAIDILSATSSNSQTKSPFTSYRDFYEAYLRKSTTPTQVAERLLSIIASTHSRDHSNPKYLNHINQYSRDSILEQARYSTQRYQSDRPLSPLDGVPILVKDEVDVEKFPTRCGTVFLNDGKPAKADAFTVQRLRDAGAIIVGKTAMMEVGWDIFSINPNTGTPRNPYNLGHSCGGSSGGSGGAVAAGLCPIAIGCDGGGSVRIPASFCGVFGLKPTHGRISARGEFPLAPTVATQGPLACSVDDLAIAYLFMAGPDPKESLTLRQPPVHIPRSYFSSSLKGVRIGILPSYSSQVQNPAISNALAFIQRQLEIHGAELVHIDIPWLDEARVAHSITISCEMYSLLSAYPWSQRRKLLWSNRITMRVVEQLESRDYVRAQQVRTKIIQNMIEIFSPAGKNISYILTPSTAITAPALPSPRVLSYGSSDQTLTSDGMRYAFLANFAGIPAVSVPVGVDKMGMPIGIQFQGEWWNEGGLLQMAKWAETVVNHDESLKPRKPSAWVGNLLENDYRKSSKL